MFSLNPKKNTNRVFTVLVMFSAIFALGEFITRISDTQELALIGGRIGYSIFPIVSCIVVHFASIFPQKNPNENNIFIRCNKGCLLILYSVSIVISIAFDRIVSLQNVQMSEWGYRVILNNSTNFLIFWFLFCGTYALYILFHKYYKKNVSSVGKKQIKFMMAGLLTVFLFSLVTNLIPPLFNITLLPMTSISLTIFTLIVAYAMIKYRLMALTIAETADIVMDTMADSLIVVNEIGTIINVNKSTLNLLNYHREKELIGSPLEKVMSIYELKDGGSNKNIELSLFNRLSLNDKSKSTEFQFITKDGKTIPMNVSVSIIYDAEKNIEGIVIAARDLTVTKKLINDLQEAKNKLEERVKERTIKLVNTNKELQIEIKERKRTEEKLRRSQTKIEQQNIQLKKADRIKTDFLNVTSHELRTPMSSIKGYTQMISKQILGQTNDEQKKALDVILRNTNRLDALIQDILDVSRLESGMMKFITQKTDVTKMVKEITETMQASTDLKRIKINSDVQKEIPDLMIDQERIKQVLINIVDNAIKFSPDGSMIHIKASKEKEDVLFEVEDFGRGIPKNKQKRIFERFYQVDSGIDRKFGGVGLGLTISRGIILAHGGKIWVKSKMNEGSTLSFTLPIKPVQDIETRFKELNIFGLEKIETA